MRKKQLLSMPQLLAGDEMLCAVQSDIPTRVKGWNGQFRNEYQYSMFFGAQIQDGILELGVFYPDHLRTGSRLPAYEVYVSYAERAFLTYDRLRDRWLTGKLDRIDLSSSIWNYKSLWIGAADNEAVLQYMHSEEESGVYAVLHFQQDIREEQLEKRYRKITDKWDEDLSQVPALPKDWERWLSKVAIPENYLFYEYHRGGATSGICTYCDREVPIIGHSRHNRMGKCGRCGRAVQFKAMGRFGLFSTKQVFAYLLQKCKDGFVVRCFQARRFYTRGNIHSRLIWTEVRRAIVSDPRNLRCYVWEMFRQRYFRYVPAGEYALTGNSYWYGRDHYRGRVYGKTIPSLAKEAHHLYGLGDWLKQEPICDPEEYLAVLREVPIWEKLWKADLPALARECWENYRNFADYLYNAEAPSLVKSLGLDEARLKRLRMLRGTSVLLGWLQQEKSSGKPIDDATLFWFNENKLRASDLDFILDRMTPVQVRNYLTRKSAEYGDSVGRVLIKWKDYLSMARKLHMDTGDEIVYRVNKLYERHDELVLRCQEKELEIEAEEISEKFPQVDAICRSLAGKYEYAGRKYLVKAPSGILDVLLEGRALQHCVGSSDRYWDRIQSRESYILFLRKASCPGVPYYTLEVEPGGTVRQKRTKFDRQGKDIQHVEKFLAKWQQEVARRLTDADQQLAKSSREQRIVELAQLQKDRVVIHTGDLSGHLLADVLRDDLMEAEQTAA